MSFWTLLWHRLRAYWRVPFFGRRLLSSVLMGLMLLYLGGALVLLGMLFDDLVHEVHPDANPLIVASRWLLPLGLGYAALRIVMESGLGIDPQPYQVLPIRRSVLVGFLAILALFSAWNAVPLIFVVTVCVEAAMSGASGEALRFGVVCLGVLAAVTYGVPMARRVLSDRPVVAAAGVLLVVGGIGIEAIDVAAGVASLLDVSGWLIGGVVQGRILLVAGVAVALAGVVAGYARWLRGAMVVDRRQRSGSVRGPAPFLDELAQRGPTMREAVLELRQLLRNAQPRLALFTSGLFVVAISILGLMPLEMADLREAAPMEMFNLAIFPGLFGTGAFIIFYGQNLFSWEGNHFEATMARPGSVRHRVTGKGLFLAASTLPCFLIPLPLLLGRQSPFLLVHTVFFVYNVGVLVPVVVAGATFNRKALAINEIRLTQTNFSAMRVLLVLLAYGLPLLPLLFFDDLFLRFAFIASIGGLSFLALPLWIRGITALYRRNRYAMARGFRASRK